MSTQICNYLYRSRVRWGILTNGRVWRLYERERSSAGGIYYEVDLEHILQLGHRDAFKYFFLFFRRLAFVPDAAGLSFVEKVFQGSVDYAAQVGNRLKESVYDALRFLMNGFLTHRANGLDGQDPAVLKLVHENALIVLYRLLFLLYAEDRNLLPRKDEPYASYSLYRLQREINDRLRAGTTYPPLGHRFWSELTNLFELIDQGFEEGHIPAYNGGLFSPAKYPHIAHTAQPGVPRWEIGDHYLAQAIDLLAYERERWNEPGSQDVDYATLAVQHLGSIYEGLLELQPHLAGDALIETLEDNKPVFKPAGEVPNPRPVRGQPPRTVAQGEVYLVTNRGERKATGSYYTPKYIVDYIVEHTVGPLATEAAAKVASLAPEVNAQVARLKKTRREWEKQAGNGKGPLTKKQLATLTKELDATRNRLLEPYLELKILDPAMGSGHFLVGAADFLSLAMATDPNLPHDLAGDDPQAFYKRQIVERCLYGVDLNPLAVELAKLSLWLHTVSRNKALSFLDHHLRCGNSLIGARIEEDLKREPPQFNARGRRINTDAEPLFAGLDAILTLARLQALLDAFRRIMDLPSGDARAERDKAAIYAAMDKERDKLRSVAHCWLAPYFDAPVTAMQYEHAVKALHDTVAWEALQQESWFQAACGVGRERHFFHWELEFPEVFFGPQGLKPQEARGFDAVIGNPPWEKITASAAEKPYLEQFFRAIKEGEINFYTLFLCHCHHLSHVSGRVGQLVPNTWLINKLDCLVRRFMLSCFQVERLFYLCKEIFPDAPDTIPVITHTVKKLPPSVPDEDDRTEVKVANDGLLGKPEFLAVPSWDDHGKAAVWYGRPLHQISVYDTEQNQPFLASLGDNSIPLGEIAHASDGIYKSTVEHYKKTQASHNSDRPVIESADQVQRYACEWAGAFIPAELWSRHQELHNGEKIILHAARKPKLRRRLVAAYTAEDIFFSNRFILVKVLHQDYLAPFVLALINAEPMNTWFRMRFPITDVDAYMLHQLPIRRIDFTTSAAERERHLVKGKQLYERCLTKQDQACVLGHVEHQLARHPEQADVVHDLLAFLAEQMISLNRQKQEEVGGFLRWLERKIGAVVDGLTNKTRLRAYHEHDFDGLLEVLRQNRRKLSIDPDARATQEAIDREFSQSLERLTPLKAKIAATDRLIDQIVYRLYGLTEQEIAIVEGT